MNNYKTALWVALMLGVVGCQKGSLDSNPWIEGVSTTLQIGLTPSKMEPVGRGVLEADKEQEVVSLAVFIFDPNGVLVSSALHESVAPHLVPAGGKLHDGSSYINIPAISGPERQIYVVANYDADQIENLKSISSLNEFKTLVVRFYANPIYREFGMIKVGHKTQDIPSNGAAVSIELEYLSAKVTIKVVNKSPDLLIQSWSVGNVPAKSYLFERDYHPTSPNTHDAVDQTNLQDFYNDFSTLALPFDTSDAPGVGTPGGKNYQVSFYLAENRQGTRPLAERKPLEPPYTYLTEGDYKLKSWDAPRTASYITVRGQQNPTTNPKTILIKHYLGNNDNGRFDNYDIFRGVHYTYTLTINNLNQIQIDTNVEGYDDPLAIEQGANLESLDGHASFRVFVLHTEADLPPDTQISAELANFANSTDYPDWLKLSLVPLSAAQLRDPANSPKISRWQQPGSDWSYVRTKFIPHSSKRSTYELPFAGFSFFGTPSTPPTLNDADHPDWVNGKDSYPAYDNELPYAWAGRRMCNRITDFPKTAQPTQLFLYADEHPIDGNDERSAVLRIIHQHHGIKTTKVYKIVQKAPIVFMGLPGQNELMVVEQMEEYAHLLDNKLPLELQLLAGLQWGNYPGVALSPNQGALNTLQGVYQTVTDPNNYSANLYVPKYGSLGGRWSSANQGRIPEGSPKGPLVGAPYYSFYAGPTNDYYHSIYNTTAARYCHEKNWDQNGNGTIDPQEAKWYLPSQEELQLFWTYRERLNLYKDYYWSSTAADDTKAYAVSMIEGPSDPQYAYNGVQQPLSKVAVAGYNRPRVRCVRRVAVGGAIKRYMPMVIYENKSLLIDCSNLTAAMYTNESKYGLSQNDATKLQTANSQVYKKLFVQLEQPAPITYAPLHLNGGGCNESTGWRLPTQRELLLIWSVKDEIKRKAGNAFADFTLGTYWTMTRGISKQYLVDFSTGLARYDDYSLSSSAPLHYRCVKEVP